MLPKLIVVGAAVFNAAYVESTGGSSTEPQRFGLACRGAMITANQQAPGNKVVADGIVDLTNSHVSGFGIGAAPILAVTTERVHFGTPILQKGSGGHVIEGTLHRPSGATHVVVRSGKAPETVLFEMRLECRATPQG